MKRIISVTFVFVLLLGMLPVGAWAAPAEAALSGSCGEGVTWSFDSGTLTISGSGEMSDYISEAPPWANHRHDIKKVVFTGGVTYAGACAFTDYDEIEAVDFGDSMHTVGEQAFMKCDGLTSIVLPATFRCFGKESFFGCQNLESVYCLGGMPSFKNSCLWDTYTTVFFPTTNAWPGDAVQQLLNSYQFKITIQPGTAPVQETAEPVETQAAEPAATEAPTVPETTQAETLPATEVTEAAAPATEATQAPSEETQPATRATEPEWLHETYAPEEPEDKQEKRGIPMGLLVGACILSGVLALTLIGVLVFRRRDY